MNSLWAVETSCALLGRPFNRQLVNKQLVPPTNLASFLQTLDELGVNATAAQANKNATGIEKLLPCLVVTRPRTTTNTDQTETTVSILAAEAGGSFFELSADASDPVALNRDAVAARIVGRDVYKLRAKDIAAQDPDAVTFAQSNQTFGFRWFVPELLKHKSIWRDVLIASLAIQLLALATPLFTQVVIDKVVVHRTQSTLIALMTGMVAIAFFTGVLSWLRQYLVLHTGNRVDAVLGSAVFERLLKLPPMYFHYRPTGVITARLGGIESIREFMASAAITLILDIPFVFIFLAIMLYYSVQLTLVVCALLLFITLLSLLVAPAFQKLLQEQFLLSARNQAYVTEFVSANDTVKSLQLEPVVGQTYRQYLASYLNACFATRQLSNTYGAFAQFIEQLSTIAVLGLGAWIVMKGQDFTIGMLVAFQMFASRVSQPVMRMVGTWQQFQQAKLAVDRLGDMMNAPVEPYSLEARRAKSGKTTLQIDAIGFKYGPELPLLYSDVSALIAAGSTIAITGPSGCGKSTLAKLLQGFYRPTHGRILLDGVDIAHFAANELRSYFGVVPQETVLFSGTILENLTLANPHASFEQVVAACKLAEVHAAIEQLPLGYKTAIGERGVGLSGGQRQRISIARALLKQPEILIFDEATSALDAPTAEAFAQTVNSLRGRVTMIFITHAIPKKLQIDQTLALTPTGFIKVEQGQSA